MTMRVDKLLLDLVTSDALARLGELSVSGLSLDSRTIDAGQAFCALRGAREHGIAHAEEAVARGASVILAQAPAVEIDSSSVPVVWVENLAEKLGGIAARFYGEPSRQLRVIGITGTNGKTSTVQLLAQALNHLGHRAASIGTLGAGLVGELREGERTTPDAIQVQALLAQFVTQGVTHVAMEVSSHALDQHRVGAVRFELAGFTNLTRDHLDYHGDMQAYGAAKARLFSAPGLRAAVINTDDAFGRELADSLVPTLALTRLSMADDAAAELLASHVVTSDTGLSFQLRTPWGTREVHSALLGRFNVANLIMVAGCLAALGESLQPVVDALNRLSPVNGRMSGMGGGPEQPLVVVDYAHTPDALEQSLTALRAHCAGRLICVFGCGGERDPGKRPLMGEVAERLADVVIVTDDNPRGENGDAIVRQIVAGLQHSELALVERDRAAAIADALRMAAAGDVVLIAGKGHETYQEGASGKLAFDDLAVARAALEACS